MHIIDKLLSSNNDDDNNLINNANEFIDFVETFLHCKIEIEMHVPHDKWWQCFSIEPNCFSTPKIEPIYRHFFSNDIPIDTILSLTPITSEIVAIQHQQHAHCPIPIVGTECHLFSHVNMEQVTKDMYIPCFTHPIVNEERECITMKTHSSEYQCILANGNNDGNDNDFSSFFVDDLQLHFIGGNILHVTSYESDIAPMTTTSIMKTIAFLTYHYYKKTIKMNVILPQVLCNEWKYIPKKHFNIRALLGMIAYERKHLDLWQIKDSLEGINTPSADEISQVLYLNTITK